MDTATPYLALGLFREGEGLGWVVRVGRRHDEALFDLLEDLLRAVGVRREAIRTLVLGEGPGSYTGLRIALSAGEGLALALGARVYGVSSLLAAAWPFLGETPLTPLFTARNGVYYGATYAKQEGRPLTLTPPQRLSAQGLPGTPLLLDPPPDPLALYRLRPFAHEGLRPLYL